MPTRIGDKIGDQLSAMAFLWETIAGHVPATINHQAFKKSSDKPFTICYF
jgi:hypothetical protein